MAITAAAIIVDTEICFSLRICHIKSYCKINAKKIKLRRKIKSKIKPNQALVSRRLGWLENVFKQQADYDVL